MTGPMRRLYRRMMALRGERAHGQSSREGARVRLWVGCEERSETMAWTLTGELVETCSCNMLCPCWYGVKELMIMDRGWCASTQWYLNENGRSADVDLGGRTVVLTMDFP